MKRLISCSVAAFLLLAFAGACNKTEDSSDKKKDATLFLGMIYAMMPPCTDSGVPYHEITLDYGSGRTPYEMGQYYGQQILGWIPQYEEIIDWYIYIASTQTPYNTLIANARIMKNSGQIPDNYKQEIEGLASQCQGFSVDPPKRGDGRLSLDEVYVLQFLPDIIYATGCSSIAAWGSNTSDGQTIIGRNLDWFGGYPHNYLSQIQGVVTILNTPASGKKNVCLIGYLGFAGCLTGFNTDGVFGATHVSNDEFNGSLADSASYPINLRQALEDGNSDSVVNIGAFLDDYSFFAGHLIFVADKNEARVFEYNPGAEATDLKVLRKWDDDLNPNVTPWKNDTSYAIGAVNSFVYKGNYDNHTGRESNYLRWDALKQQLVDKLADSKVTTDEIIDIITYYSGTEPGNYDVYNTSNQQTVIYQPGLNPKQAQVHFHQQCVSSSGVPPAFYTITAAFP